MSTSSSNLDWITYVPRRVHDAARRLEAACDRCVCPSPIGVAEYRSDFRHAPSTPKGGTGGNAVESIMIHRVVTALGDRT